MTTTQLHRNALASALALALFAPMGAQAQITTPAQEPAPATTPAPASTSKPTEIDKVVVTGSRIKRAEIEGPAPVFVITGEQIKAEGFSTVYDALQSLTEVTGTVEGDVSWGQHTINASPLNLRALGPGRSLLLINGRRVADYPLPYQGRSNFANYNNIPSGAVERIEVLTGGASAIYGSDAMAGVINVILKTNYEGDEVKARVGTTTRGGYDHYDLSWNGGKVGDNWSVTYAFQWYKRDPLRTKDRDFVNKEKGANPLSWGPEQRAVGTGTLVPGASNSLLDYYDSTGGDYGFTDPPAGACESFGDERQPFNVRRWDRNTNTFRDRGGMCEGTLISDWTLYNGNDSKSGYLYGTYDFANSMQAWATLGVWKGEGKSMTFGKAGIAGRTAPGFTWYDPGYGKVVSFGIHRFAGVEMGGLEAGAYTHSKELSWDFHTGLRGTMFSDRFDWDFAIGRAEYSVDEHFPARLLTKNALNDSLMGLGPSEGTYTNPDDGAEYDIRRLDQNRFWSPITPEEYWSIHTIGKNHAESDITQASFTLSGDLFEGWAGPIGFAAAVDAAQQGYALEPDPNTLTVRDPVTGAVIRTRTYAQTVNTDLGGGDRKHWGAGLEFRVPLLESLDLSLAGRHDDYDQTRDQAARTWQVGLEYRPIEALLFRGSMGTTFRAPDMHYVYAQDSTTLIDARDYYYCLTHGDPNRCDTDREGDVQDIPGRREGSADLAYETGKAWTAGFVWDVIDNLSLSADYWDIEIEDEIDDISRDQVTRDEAFCRLGRYPSQDEPITFTPGPGLCALQISRVTRGTDPDGAGPELGPILAVKTGPINRAFRGVEGIDAAIKYQLNTDKFGQFLFAFNHTQQRHSRRQQTPGDPIQDDADHLNRSRASVAWEKDKWNATLYGDRQSGGKQRWGSCEVFADGYRPEASDDCVDTQAGPANPNLPISPTNPGSPTAGQKTHLVYEHNDDPIFFNMSLGYKLTDQAKLSFYVNNMFDKLYSNPYCGDFAYCYSGVVGREISAEFAYKFD